MIEAILILAVVLFCIVLEWADRKERKQSRTINAANNNLYIARRLK